MREKRDVHGSGRSGSDVGRGIRGGRGADSGADARRPTEHAVLGHDAELGKEAVEEVFEEPTDYRPGTQLVCLVCEILQRSDVRLCG